MLNRLCVCVDARERERERLVSLWVCAGQDGSWKGCPRSCWVVCMKQVPWVPSRVESRRERPGGGGGGVEKGGGGGAG